MKWEELIQRIALDDEDREAYGRYQAWVQQQQFKTDRNLYIENWYDPDIVNEFCYYPVSSWDKLIQWAKEYYGEELCNLLVKIYDFCKKSGYVIYQHATDLDSANNIINNAYKGELSIQQA